MTRPQHPNLRPDLRVRGEGAAPPGTDAHRLGLATNLDIVVSDGAASDEIDRFDGGTRPTALATHVGSRHADYEASTPGSGAAEAQTGPGALSPSGSSPEPSPHFATSDGLGAPPRRPLVNREPAPHIPCVSSVLCRETSGRSSPTRRTLRDNHACAFRYVRGACRGRGYPSKILQPYRQTAAAVTASMSADLARDNSFLRQRNAQLQGDVTALQAEVERLRQIVERLHGRTPGRPPNPLGGGQSS